MRINMGADAGKYGGRCGSIWGQMRVDMGADPGQYEGRCGSLWGQMRVKVGAAQGQLGLTGGSWGQLWTAEGN